ncbi:metallophosphoesterase [Advenella mimigardefordensis]|uniref:Serine/threonine-protein phosphatase n=1 Tax=Advenella mimigardefordensis (strain DSM 17166 / LMG 22922 / DPN7) TaxID=1247726 RepID=W0PEV4_ADVMD|nr:metallophosphoesterase [Advenella mimigardefordensis]AHG63800.1 serine/threonine-protein phosphatase [Advenella mimigardefordensis DPN7]
MAYVHTFDLNRVGRDFVVGDIHGHYTKLMHALDNVAFDAGQDRLFSVGDLVDRGTENEPVVNLIGTGWFFPVCGNHDDYAIRYHRIGRMDEDNYRRNGGSWFIETSTDKREKLVAQLERLPMAIEVATINGRIGIVHADVPCRHWNNLERYLTSKSGRQRVMWSRDRFERQDTTRVDGVDHVIVGHNCHPDIITLGNVHHIDTGGWLPDEHKGHFTLLEISKPGLL